MSAARLNSRALTVRGTLPQIGSFSLGWARAVAAMMRSAGSRGGWPGRKADAINSFGGMGASRGMTG